MRSDLVGIALILAWATEASGGPSPPINPVRDDWHSAIQRDIAAREYHVSWQDATAHPDIPAAYQAPNRANNFRTYFTNDGFRVVPRAEQASPWRWGLSLAAYGRAGATQPLARVEPCIDANRVEYQRDGLIEWYVNDARGLEQGFTILRPPAAVGSAVRTIRLEMALLGNATAKSSPDYQTVDFLAPGSAPAIRFADLHAADATGRALPVRFEIGSAVRTASDVNNNGPHIGPYGHSQLLSIVVDDRGAVYPITIDPLATSPSWTAESDQEGAFFGYSVATAGDVNGDGYSDVIVGAWGYTNDQFAEGRAFVFHGSAGGLSASADWTGESNQVSAYFGYSVATAGDVNGDGYSDVIVGAHFYTNGQAAEGRAYVYHGSASGLSPTANWTAESNHADAFFGASVATAGDVNGDGYSDVIVGAYDYSGPESGEGRVFVFHGSSGGLNPTANWIAESNTEGAQFGSFVATAGDVNADGFGDVVVGAWGYTNDQFSEGRAFVFHGSASGLSASADWTAEGDQEGALFGYSVASAGDVNGDGFSDVIVSAYRYDNGENNEGRAFVYHGSSTGLGPVHAWSAEGEQINALFGDAVSTAGDVNGDGYGDVIVGASGFNNDQNAEGRAFVYYGSAAGLSSIANWTAESNQGGSGFGRSSATAGDVNGDGFSDVIVGAYDFDKGQNQEGRAFAYQGGPAGLSTTAGWSDESNQADAWFGWSVGSAGDVNGDGYGDIVVGAINFDAGEANEGAVFVYHGSPSGPANTADWFAESNQAFTEFGYDAGTAGDVNGDGYDDLIVGSPQYGNSEFAEGRAWLYLGSSAGLSATPVWTAESNQTDARMGRMVGTAGDVNADGYADVVIGSYSYSNGETDEGIALVFHGSPGGLGATGTPQNADWMSEGNQVTAWYGRSGGTAGDVNGDGYSDLIIGSYRYSNGEAQEGAVFVYHGSPIGLSPTPNWIAEPNLVNVAFGFSSGTAGDVNGDGYSDVIVGAVSYSNGQFWEGAAFIYTGSAGGLSTSPSWVAESNQIEARLGWSTGTAGDVNDDGYSDIIVASYLYDDDQANEGRVFVYHGSPLGPSPVPDWFVESNQSNAQFGYSAAFAGDVNGDGFGDVVIGAYAFDDGESDEGKAFVYYGNNGPGRSLAPQQRRADDSAPIADLGRSDSPTGMLLAALGRTPFGRGKVKLEWETKPLGTALDGSGLQASSIFVGTGLSGTLLKDGPDDLACGKPYHWRVRVKYDPVSVPFAPHSRWVNMQAKSLHEADLRTAPVPGDMNCDCALDLDDMVGLVLALVDPIAYSAANPLCGPGADMQPDGHLDGDDIAAFTELLVD